LDYFSSCWAHIPNEYLVSMSTNSLKKFPCQLKILPELMVWNLVYLWQVMQDIGSEMDLCENNLPPQGLIIVSFFYPFDLPKIGTLADASQGEICTSIVVVKGTDTG